MLNNVQAYEEQHSSQFVHCHHISFVRSLKQACANRQGTQSYLEEVQATLDRLLQVVQDAQTVSMRAVLSCLDHH